MFKPNFFCFHLEGQWRKKLDPDPLVKRHGSADPDPDPPQNVMDPQHWIFFFFLSEFIASGAAVLGKELAEPLLPVDSWLDVLSAQQVVSPSKFNVRLAAGKLTFLVPSWLGTNYLKWVLCNMSLLSCGSENLSSRSLNTCRYYEKHVGNTEYSGDLIFSFIIYPVGSNIFYGFGSRRPINYGFIGSEFGLGFRFTTLILTIILPGNKLATWS